MAPPIPLEIPPRDPRAELQARLNRAPLEHAEALLDWLEVLQGLHDRGVFEFVRGALGAGDQLTQMAAEAAKSPESVRAIRNILILGKTLAAIDPAALESFAKALPQANAQSNARPAAPAPSIWSLLRQFGNKDVRRGIAAVNRLLEAWGKSLSQGN
ncbi:MAG: DUF1641 domain-containing protein [Candidatus Acidiferrales bacterium]